MNVSNLHLALILAKDIHISERNKNIQKKTPISAKHFRLIRMMWIGPAYLGCQMYTLHANYIVYISNTMINNKSNTKIRIAIFKFLDHNFNFPNIRCVKNQLKHLFLIKAPRLNLKNI